MDNKKRLKSAFDNQNGGAYVTKNEPVIVLKDCFVIRVTYERKYTVLRLFNVNADEKADCIVLEDGTIVCEEDLAEGCRINEELSIIECGLDPLNDDDKFPRG